MKNEESAGLSKFAENKKGSDASPIKVEKLQSDREEVEAIIETHVGKLTEKEAEEFF